MDQLIRKRTMPNVYVSENTFSPSLAANGESQKLLNRFNLSESMTSSVSDVDVSKRVTFNVGGMIFQTTDKLFQKISKKYFKAKDTRFLTNHYDSVRDEYFFDRDPEVFRSVLNYWRTGYLHIPTTMCGPQIIDEMEFWGLSPMEIQPCCFNTYNSWIKSMHALKKLEKDRQLSYLKPQKAVSNPNDSKFKRLRLATWYLLTDPSYSRYAKIYAYMSLFFVTLAIFSFCASTYSGFQITRTIHHPHQVNHTDNNINNNSISIETTTPLSGHNDTANTITITTNNNNNNNAKSKNNCDTKNTTTQTPNTSVVTEVHPVLTYIDLICLALFTFEYLVRLACAPERLNFIFSFTAIVDLLAIMPDYIEFIVFAFYPEDSSNGLVQFMPFLRLMRVFRIFRLAQRVPGLWIMIYTLRASYKELSLMLMFLLVGTLFFSSVIYFVDDKAIFKSIPTSFWWAIVTMTTVGYGDLTPTTAWGQLVGSITAVCGVLLVGFTIPALVNNFITYCQFVEFAMRSEAVVVEDMKKFACKDDDDDVDDVDGHNEDGDNEMCECKYTGGDDDDHNDNNGNENTKKGVAASQHEEDETAGKWNSRGGKGGNYSGGGVNGADGDDAAAGGGGSRIGNSTNNNNNNNNNDDGDNAISCVLSELPSPNDEMYIPLGLSSKDEYIPLTLKT